MSPAIILDGKDINSEILEIFLEEKIANINNIERLIINLQNEGFKKAYICLLYTSPSPRDRQKSRMPSSA